MADISLLKIERGRVKGSLTKLKNYLKELPADTSIEDLEIRLEKLEELQGNFVTVDDKLALNGVESECEEFEDKYLEVKAKLRRLIRDETTTNAQNSEDLNETINKMAEQQRAFLDGFNQSSTALKQIKLPKVDIPHFSGDYKDWPSFKDLFTSSIHNNKDLPDVHKLQYLKGLLKGEAFALVKHLTLSEASYCEAWAKLIRRYDKKKQIVAAYIQAFINQPHITQPTAASLRKLVDTSDQLIRGIDVLGREASGRDPWLVYLILSKTDTETRKAWSEETTNKDFPSFETFLEFLSTRCDALESCDSSIKKPSNTFSVRSHHLDTIARCHKCFQAHTLSKCPDYKAMDTTARRNYVGKNSLCFNCLTVGHTAQKCRSTIRCHYCKHLHHSSLHLFDQPNPSTSAARLSSQPRSSQSQGNSQPVQRSLNVSATTFNPQPSTSGSIATTVNSYSISKDNQGKIILLPTALVYIANIHGIFQLCRVLLDSGSQASFISEECVQRLGLQRSKGKITVRGISSGKAAITKGSVTVSLHSRTTYAHLLSVQVFILDKLTAPQPSRSFNQNIKSHIINDYVLADPFFNQSRKIDILLGADYFMQSLKDGRIQVSAELPPLQNTIFGFIIAGPIKLEQDTPNVTSLHLHIDEIDASLRRFWEIEEPPQQDREFTIEEQQCEDHFVQTHEVDPVSKRYMVQLPFKESNPYFGDSLSAAVSRLKSIERKCKGNSALHCEYSKFMKEYEDLGHLEHIPRNIITTSDDHFYLPHHAVLKPSSTTTKLRVVFDGSSPSSTGLSLNQALLIGPKVHRDLLPILLSFRSFKVAVVGDIEKMYRQVMVHPKHRNFQRIVWRENPNEEVQHLRLTTVTYGTSSAPFLATRSLNQLTVEFKGELPLAEEAIKNNFYVDDLLGGANDETEAFKLCEQLTILLSRRGFKIHKWASNSQDLMNTISNGNREESDKIINDYPDSVRVLGLKWIPLEDYFSFEVTPFANSSPTKRVILSESSKIFDPLGFISPVTITFKILLQQLWLQHCDWDETSEMVSEKWNNLRSNLLCLKQLQIPRWLCINAHNTQLHGFSDASQLAYAAVVYIRSEDSYGNIHINIAASKSRVAPIKQLSIPRLELCGAVLLTNLISFVKSTLNIPNHHCFGWTDSKVVLSWLSAHPRRWKCFVGNRTSTILSVIPRQQWSYVQSAENPADLASRGINASELVKFTSSNLWWEGPSWLKTNWKEQPPKGSSINEENAEVMEEQRENYSNSLVAQLESNIVPAPVKEHLLMPMFKEHSSLTTILRILSRCFQFVRNCREHIQGNRTSWTTTQDMQQALRACVLWAQSESFPEEIKCLKSHQPLNSSSKILKLTPFLDVITNDTLRVGGRIENSRQPCEVKHPAILPKNHIFTHYLISHLHEKYLHAGTTLLLNIIRQKYWILSCRTLVKSHLNKCVTCVRHRAHTSQQLMANLPTHRVGAFKPFQNVGIDYAGPIHILMRRCRGARTTKGYIALFVCFSTRAIHLELASDLTSETFIGCFKRFASRRGIPTTIYSDNGTNFVGAKRQLDEIQRHLSSLFKTTPVLNFLISNEITWKFNPPAAPHFGGLWEAGVRSVKTILRKTIGETRLTYEEMNTLLTQIEALLNSRPLVPLTDDPSSLDSLTPGHFLIGQPITAFPEIPLDNPPLSLQNKWRLVQHMHQTFWKRWHLEYLSTLQHRPKWQRIEPNISTGDLVVIKEPNIPPSRWLLGRVIDTHPGKDGLVRVSTLRTQSGIIKRPASRLCKLPVAANPEGLSS